MIQNNHDVPALDNNPFAPLAETPDQALGNEINNSNENVNNYIISSRSVCIRSSQQPTTTTANEPIKATFIVDSAAYPHMMNDHDMFTSLLPWQGDIKYVTLADGQARAPIMGVGTISLTIAKHTTTLHDVLYVPSLSDPLFSVQKHVELAGNYVHIENTQTIIAFPTFIATVPIQKEIYLQVCKQTEITTPCAKATTYKQPPPQHIPFVKMNTNAKYPIKSSPNSAGYDLFNTHDVTIAPGERMKISTGIKIQIPTHHYGRIAPSSSLAIQHHNIDVAAGVIDSDYRGEIFPVLINNGSKYITFPKHTKICQLLIVKISNLDLIEVAELNKTIRNEGGFGSTDKMFKTPSAKKTTTKIDDNTTTNPFKWTKINNSPTKVTIQLPWNDHYSKGHIQKCLNGFQFSSIDDPEIQHILPSHHIKSMTQSNKILLGHKHRINESISNTVKTYPIKRTIDTPLSHIPTSATMTIDHNNL